MFIVAALYKFTDLPDYKSLQNVLKSFCQSQGITGTLLLATEGINGTVAGTREAINALIDWFMRDVRFHNLEYKESLSETCPFYRLKVRLKKEIVTLGVPGVNPTVQKGTYVEPEEWNQLLQDSEVVLIDVRNDYEVHIGSFKGAINPQTTCFTQFPKVVEKKFNPTQQKKIAMFCTGGIRCEKASSYLLAQGFENVYHLKGGILKYLETIPAERSLWEGDCFVFDRRVSVDHSLAEGNYSLCYGCRTPLSSEDLLKEAYEKGVSCHHCVEKLSKAKKKNLRERQKQITLAAQKGETHMGVSHGDI